VNPRAMDFLTALFFAGIFFFTGIEIIHFAKEAHPWIVGDWAINYSQGFIRRGVVGELVRQLAALSRLPWIGIIAAIQILSYGSILWCTYGLLKQSSYIRWIFFLLSPATFLFPLYSNDGGYRKEILFYAFLLGLSAVCLSRRHRPGPGTFALLSAPVFSGALVLAHEGLFAYFPYYVALALVLARHKSRRYRYALALLPVLSGLIAVTFSIHSPGSVAMSQGICRSLGPVAQTTTLCHGAIALLGASAHAWHEVVVWHIRESSYFKIYGTTAVLASLPFVFYILGRRDQWRHRPFVLSVVVLPTVAMLTSLPLFFVAVDWGRFIHMHAMSVFIVILAYEAAASNDNPQPLRHTPRPWPAGLLFLVAAVYMTTWTLPHCCGNGFEMNMPAIRTRLESHVLEVFGSLSASRRRLDLSGALWPH
jgi:hypothetical protein